MDRPLVSVIIPLYNAEKYIDECLESVLNQSWTPLEVLVIDDGSTDLSYQKAKQYAGNKVQVFKQVNQGASVARNFGILKSRGSVLQFMDADDLLSRDKIEKQMAVLSENDGHLAICDTVHFDDGTYPYSQPPTLEWFSSGRHEPYDFLIKLYSGKLLDKSYGGMVQPNAWLTPRKVIEKAGLWDPMRCPDDDGEFFCRVVLASKGVIYAPGSINYYRKFKSGLSLSARKDYISSSNILIATDKKARHLLTYADTDLSRLAISRLYWENAFMFYPVFKELSLLAESKARQICPTLRLQPYDTGINAILSRLTGWKTVKNLQAIKSFFKKRLIINS